MRPFVVDFVARHLTGLAVTAAVPAAATTPHVGTHDGSFHCDEAMACGLLRHTEAFANVGVVRTRDETQLTQCSIVVDVGGVYDEAAQRFDHHQKEFIGTMTTPVKTYATRLSSAGLVYKHFGRQLIRRYADHCRSANVIRETLSDADTDLLFDRVYRSFVEQVDGIDNGVSEFSPEPPGTSLLRNYRTSTSLSARVGSLNPRWNDTPPAASSPKEHENACFATAVTLATNEFYECVDYYVCSWLPARSVVASAFHAAAEAHPSKQILVFQQGGCPWREHLSDIEEELGCTGRTLYVLFPDGTGRSWRIQAVPKEATGFENRKSIPWKGLRDEALSEASGVPGGVFVHVSGFIGGNKTFDGAMAMAVKALEM